MQKEDTTPAWQREARERLNARCETYYEVGVSYRSGRDDIRRALDALDRVRALTETGGSLDNGGPLDQVWSNAMGHVRAALDGERAKKALAPAFDDRARVEDSLRHKAVYGPSVAIREEARELLIALEAQTAHDAARPALDGERAEKGAAR